MGPGSGFLRVVLVCALAALLAGALPCTASALTVTKTSDTDDGDCSPTDCSLREAIETTEPGGTVVVPSADQPYEVSDAEGTLLVTKDLVIAGEGARLTEVRATGTDARPFTVRSDVFELPDVTLRDMAISGGNGHGGGQEGMAGGVLADEGALGGPNLVLERVWVYDNEVEVGPSFQGVGGGVAADGAESHVTIRESLITGNRVVAETLAQATGGGLATFALATMTIENSTVAGNEARGSSDTSHSALGGGAVVGDGSAVINSTIADNRAVHTGGAALPSRGGNLSAVGTAAVRNTIVTGGQAAEAGTEDCAAPITLQSKGGNVLPAGCGPVASDRAASDALLGPLSDNGGETDTMAVLPGSPAIDAALACPPPTVDQRGLPRPVGPGCDSGAFELQTLPQARPPEFVPGCLGKPATIVGTGASEVLKGSRRADVIVAFAGNDTIRSGRGNDVVCAGSGKDTVRAGPGRDEVLGQKGSDAILGGPGPDRLLGGRGRDSLKGGRGRDLVRGGPGRDVQQR